MNDYTMPAYGGGSPPPPKTGWRVIARHSHIAHARIAESVARDTAGRCWRRFTATIHGFQRFRLTAGVTFDPDAPDAIIKAPGKGVAGVAFAMAKAIRYDIDTHGEDALSFEMDEYSTWRVLPYEGWKENDHHA